MRGHAPPIPVMHIRALKSWKRDSNPRPTDYESVALPTALFQHNKHCAAVWQATLSLYRLKRHLARTFFKKTGSSLSDLAAAGINFSQDVPGKEQTLTNFR